MNFSGSVKQPGLRCTTLLLILISICCVCPNPLSGKNDSVLTVAQKLWLKKNSQRITLLSECNYPPYIFEKKGKPAGISMDFLHLIERKLRIKINVTPCGPLNELLLRTDEKHPVIISSLMRTPGRERRLLFTDPYVSSPVVIIVAKKNRQKLSLKQLGGKRVAAGLGFGVYEYIRKRHPEIVLVPVEDDREGLLKVTFGEVDAAVADVACATYVIEKTGISGLRVGGETGFVYQLAFACSRDFPELHAILNSALNLVSSGEKKKIKNRWMSLESSDSEFGFLLYFLIQTLFILLFFLIFRKGACLIDKKTAMDKRTGAKGLRVLLILLVVMGLWVWLNEILDLPHLLFMAPATPVNWIEALSEMVMIYAVALMGAIYMFRLLRNYSRSLQLLKERNDMISSIFQTAPVGIAMLSKRKFLFLNPRLAGMLNYTVDELVGKDIRLLYPSENEYREAGSRIYSMAEENGVGTLETRFIAKNGKILHVLLALTSKDKDAAAGDEVVFSTLDITRQKQSALELERYRKNLEQLVADRTGELEVKTLRLEHSQKEMADLLARVKEANSDLERVNKELKAFAHSVSHDLQAPLRHIRGFAKILVRREDPVSQQKQSEYLENILQAIDNMNRLIKDLLEFSRVTGREMQHSEVDLSKLLKQVQKSMAPDLTGRRVNWKINKLPRVEGDEAMLSRVFSNLIDNALKFTRGREIAEIEIGSLPSSREAIVYVRDNGVGFNEDFREKIFELFSRYHTQAEFKGSGVGLSSVKRIVHRHRGRVWAESREGEGAVFYFSLPLAKGLQQASETNGGGANRS